FALTQPGPRARPQRLGQALELRRLGLAQRSHSEKLARALTFGAALVVGGARVLVALARIDDREPPGAEPHRDVLDPQRGEVDQRGRVEAPEERGQLVQQSRAGAHPAVLDAGAELRDLPSVERRPASAGVG